MKFWASSNTTMSLFIRLPVRTVLRTNGKDTVLGILLVIVIPHHHHHRIYILAWHWKVCTGFYSFISLERFTYVMNHTMWSTRYLNSFWTSSCTAECIRKLRIGGSCNKEDLYVESVACMIVLYAGSSRKNHDWCLNLRVTLLVIQRFSSLALLLHMVQ